ncbi:MULTISPECIES: DUF6519 domain-containing protein [unclassified Rhizobium]|uniref:DUF6519 domain-containing protein n=1 Tax=unclassified Rhizobium TaxID=2613769 RepID=UPI00161DA5D8|nr:MULTISPECIES: DUF6519 domain-containing protein [unclassified Rhizobium]MBB3543253.1 parallel beta-helix repeat protein [Rhizobium sp. BK399]MCS3741735.1 parallel beta-helix repeat protein [Rhizobium sp. BK661]MCS4093538.1 parallel beta-helix repeat protein [Rhizobium sp. BK176]
MSGDYSRFTHDVRKRFSSVLIQQGRVQLDADWNEAADIARERLRVQALDTFGPVGVPHATTPDAFKVTAPVADDFKLGKGRLYVDGHLAEILQGENVSYQAQPFLPDPPAIGGVNYNVYLDLWEREVTYIEDNDLLDKALGGVDTATRVQQVWQVKTEPAAAQTPAACGAFTGTPPSGGRMSVAAVAPPAPEDPCIVPPLTGYRGLENRLYRIEIQTAGPLGTASFTWSRDNASLVTTVAEIATASGRSSLTVHRIGRDRVTRFAIGDWVCVTDDHRDLHGEAGEMAQIEDIDEANAIFRLDRTIGATGRPFATAPADLLARHTRVRKWDQSSSDPLVGADGTIPTATGPVAIEEGIEVSFSTVGSEGFHVGDYWLFSARTADASVEEFTAAPPRGIIHSYVQLAAVNGPDVSDCRPQPETSQGCCTFVLNPGDDIQLAIDQLPASGGCVCLKTGIHRLRAPLFISRNDVSLHGESTGAIVETGEGPLLTVSGRRHRIHELQFRRRRGGPAMISLVRVEDCIVDDCLISGGGGEDGGIGIAIASAQRVDIRRCTISGTDVNVQITGSRTRLLTIADCFLAGIRRDGAEDGGLPATAGILLQDGGDFSRIEDCVIGGTANGIVCLERQMDVPLEGLTVTGNRIECVASRPVLSTRNMGIGVIAESTTVSCNSVTMERSPEFAPVTAIALGGLGLRVEDNEVSIASPRGNGPPSIGMHFGWNGQQGNVITIDGLVAGNQIRDAEVGLFAEATQSSALSGNVISYRARERAALAAGLLIFNAHGNRFDGNRIEGTSFGIVAVSGENNTIERNTVAGGIVGIGMVREINASLSSNDIDAQERFGIFCFDSRGRMVVHGNSIARTGTRTDELPKIGVFLLGVSGQASVERNEVIDTGIDVDLNPSPGVAIGIAAILCLEAAIRDNIVNYSGGWDGILEKRGLNVEDRALLMQGMSLPGILQTDGTTGYPALVQGNRFEGIGFSALVQFLERDRNDPLLRFERISFSDNDCMHRVPREAEAAVTLLLKGRLALVSANAFRAFPGQPACVDFQQMTRPIFVANYFVRAPISPAPIPAAMLATNIDL